MPSAQELDSVSTKYQRIAELAKRDPGCSFTSLAHHIDLAWLKRAYQRTRKEGAVGVDEMTAKEYEQDLEANLERLLEAAKSGRYYAPPVKRVWLPKGDGSKLRPIGIPTFEDKVVPRAVARVLEAVYEQDFHEHSYGFRPGRSAHQALKTVWEELSVTQGGLGLGTRHRSLLRCARRSPALSAGEIPAPARGRAAPPGTESWAHGGNDMG